MAICRIFYFLIGYLFKLVGINVKLINNLKFKKMKNVLSIIAVAALTAGFVSCGPSAEEKQKMEERAKFVADSTANAISTTMETTAAPVDSAAAAAAATTETVAPAAEEKH